MGEVRDVLQELRLTVGDEGDIGDREWHSHMTECMISSNAAHTRSCHIRTLCVQSNTMGEVRDMLRELRLTVGDEGDSGDQEWH